VEASSSSKDKDSSFMAFSGPSVFLMIGIILVKLGPVLYMLTKKSKGGLKIFRNKGILAVFIIIGLLFSMFAAYSMMAPSTDTVPDFTVKDTRGTTRTPETYENRVLIIDIMSTDCAPCNEEMPTLISIYRQAREKYGTEVEFLTVSISSRDTDKMLDEFQARHGATWPIARNPDFVTLFDAKFTPTMIIVAPNGDLAYRHVGIVDEDDVLNAIDDAKSGNYESVSIRSTDPSLLFLGLFAGVLGAATFFSPCSFPMLPGYFSFYLATDSKGGESGKKINPIVGGIFAASGIVLFYLLIGFFVWMVTLLLNSTEWTATMFAVLTPIIGILMILFGVLMFIGKDAFLERFIEGFKHLFSRIFRRKSSEPSEAKGGAGGLFVYGFGYGAASASCMAPIFITVLFLGLQGGIFGAPVVFLTYSLALGGMMVVFSYLASSGSEAISKLISSTDKIKKITASLLVVAGIFVLLYVFFLEEYFTGIFNF
jgi:cytochrome c-type biogenesis protein